MSPEAKGWAPLVYFWDGGWLGVGHGRGVVPPHAHHAIQISIGLNGPVRLRQPDEAWGEGGAGAVLADVTHSFDPGQTLVAMLFLDPECREGRWFADSWRTPISWLPPERVAPFLDRLRAFRERRPGAAEATELFVGLVRGLCVGPAPVVRMDPRIARALELIRGWPESRIPQEAIAAQVYLSSSRFAHLFTAEVGVPFRRYLLWRKLSRAMVEFGRGSSLSVAAHAAGFSDSAHLTRTWQQMYGLSPTMMVSGWEFYEIPGPLSAGGQAVA